MGVDSGAGRWWDGVDERVVVVGHCVCKHKVGGQVWAKNPKPSCCGSISGALSEMGVDSGAGRWCNGAMRGWWWWGVMFANVRQEGGFELKTWNQAVTAQSQVHCVKWLVWGFELGCIKRVLNRMICSLPKQGQIPCIELGIELHKKKGLLTTSLFTLQCLWIFL